MTDPIFAIGEARHYAGDVSVRIVRAGWFRPDAGGFFGVVPKPLWSRFAETDDRGRLLCRLNLLLVEISGDEPFVLHPGEFALGATFERVALPDDLVARLEGKSSLGRLGLLIHSTAGYVDPGWEGTLTLELSNVANLPIKLYDGMKIGQISFQRLSSAVEVGYGDARIGSKYRGQTDPTASRYHADFERGRVVRS